MWRVGGGPDRSRRPVLTESDAAVATPTSVGRSERVVVEVLGRLVRRRRQDGGQDATAVRLRPKQFELVHCQLLQQIHTRTIDDMI